MAITSYGLTSVGWESFFSMCQIHREQCCPNYVVAKCSL